MQSTNMFIIYTRNLTRLQLPSHFRDTDQEHFNVGARCTTLVVPGAIVQRSVASIVELNTGIGV